MRIVAQRWDRASKMQTSCINGYLLIFFEGIAFCLFVEHS